MKIGDIKNKKIARKYAKALLDVATEDNALLKVKENLELINDTIKNNKQLSVVFYSPVIEIKDKKEIIKQIFEKYLTKSSLDFLFLLIDKNRTDILKETTEQYIQLINERNNIINPIIISAVELSDTQKNKIIEKLQTKMTKTIVPEYQINTDIIGGLIIEIEDKTIDCSLKTKFENMQKELTKGNKYGND